MCSRRSFGSQMPTTKKSSGQAQAHGHGQSAKEKKAAMTHGHKDKDVVQSESMSQAAPSDTQQQATPALSRAAQRKAKHTEYVPLSAVSRSQLTSFWNTGNILSHIRAHSIRRRRRSRRNTRLTRRSDTYLECTDRQAPVLLYHS